MSLALMPAFYHLWLKRGSGWVVFLQFGSGCCAFWTKEEGQVVGEKIRCSSQLCSC